MTLSSRAIEAGARAIDPNAWEDADNLTPTERRSWESAKIARQNRARANVKACLTALAAEGMVLVPKEPTEAMLNAGDSMMPQIMPGQDITTGYDALRDAWPAMLSAHQADEDSES